jgi:hypothetical protein
MRYRTETDLGSLVIRQDEAGMIIAARAGKPMHQTPSMDNMLEWLDKHRARKLRQDKPLS